MGRGAERGECQRDAEAHREALIGRAWQKLQAFLTGFPADPAADQAAFAAANAQLDLKRFDEAGKAAAASARRYPQSELLDSYWYLSAYCDFATGKSASAIEICRQGGPVPTPRQTVRPHGRWPQQVPRDLHHRPGP